MPTEPVVSDDLYKVVVNIEEQYSIWPERLPCPPGWREEGFSGTRSECVAHVDTVWSDMRPLSLRTSGQRDAGKTGKKQ